MIFLKDFIYLFLERGEGKERERERETSTCGCLSHTLWETWPTTQAGALTGNEQQPFGSQASTQPTEPHKAGLWFF